MLRAAGTSVPARRMLGLTYAANAVSASLPAGSALASVYQFRRLRAWGAGSPAAGFTLVACGVLSSLAFALLAALGATVAGARSANPISLIAGIASLGAILLAVRQLRRHQAVLVGAAGYLVTALNRLRRRPASGVPSAVRSWFDAMTAVKPVRRDWLAGLLFACLNWAADLTCLIAACRAVGADHATITLGVLAYIAGMSVSSISLVPGGLGIIDSAMILTLTRGGMHPAAAIAAVLLYRIVSYAFIVLVGWAAWTTHHLQARPAPGLADSRLR
jgi:uncharacterized protein (TIRG00374 family)